MSEKLSDIASAMVARGQGILAADESTSTIKKRFDQINTESTFESRRDYREMLFRADEAMKSYISGVILFDETLRQSAKDGTPFVELIRNAGAVPGIKVDTGAQNLAGCPGEKVTEGLDGLRKRLAEYHELGARFAKWRAVITIGEGRPSVGAIRANMHALARYAALCQEAGIVPIVEPEVTMDGENAIHDIDRCHEVTAWGLRAVYSELAEQNVQLEGTVLKPNMVIAGKESMKQASAEEVAEKTVQCLKANVPSSIAGIAFLSGGQSEVQATENLSLMNSGFDCPWPLTFSYGRALQQAALKAWVGSEVNVSAAQDAFAHRARMNGLAATGEWSGDLEN